MGHVNGHAAGRDEIIAGLKAVASLNGSAPNVMRVTKAFDESKHPRDDHGKFTTGAEIAEAAKDPAKRKELEAGMDAENKAKLAKAIDEHKGDAGAKPEGLSAGSTAKEAEQKLTELGHAYRKSGGLVNNPKGIDQAVKAAASEIGKLSREELT